MSELFININNSLYQFEGTAPAAVVNWQKDIRVVSNIQWFDWIIDEAPVVCWDKASTAGAFLFCETGEFLILESVMNPTEYWEEFKVIWWQLRVS